MIKIIIGILLISIVFVSSCKTDFDVNADYKDITLVYGLLDQYDTAQYLKVNKAFLGDANAYEMASKSDSVNYATATVFIAPVDNGTEGEKIYFDQTSEIAKLPGTFATDKNLIYKSKAALNPNFKYKLHVIVGGKHVTSETELIQDFSVNKPWPGSIVNFSKYDSKLLVEWQSAKNGKIYEVTLRLHYLEEDHNVSPNVTTEKSIDWVLPTKTSSGVEGGETIKLEINNESFFNHVSSMMQPLPNVTRIIQKASIDFMFLVGGEALNTYIEVSRPTSGLNQDKPAYTNIENGIGVFSSRLHYTRDRKPDLFGRRISDETLDSLANGVYTKNLGFLNSTKTNEYWSTHQ